jgi:hypothetical protein
MSPSSGPLRAGGKANAIVRGGALSALCRARGLADEMPVRQRTQVCAGRREPAECGFFTPEGVTLAWLPLRAESGSLSDTAAPATEQHRVVLEWPGDGHPHHLTSAGVECHLGSGALECSQLGDRPLCHQAAGGGAELVRGGDGQRSGSALHPARGSCP